MKLLSALLFLTVFIFFKENVLAQWSSDIRHTNNNGISETSWSNARNVAAADQVIHTVWDDDRFGNDEIMYKRSTDNGLNWGAVVRLTNNSGGSQKPSISVSGQTVHVVWYDDRDGNLEIYYLRSTDAGLTWGTDLRLTTNSGSSWYPSMDVFGSIVQVVWTDNRDGNNEIYYKRSTDAGINWDPVVRITNSTGSSIFPSIFTAGLITHIVWHDERDGNGEIYYNRSLNAGVTWGSDIRLTTNTAETGYPCISVSGTVAHVVWEDYVDGNYEIYYRRSPDNGQNWDAALRLTNNSAISNNVSIATSGPQLHITWTDTRNGIQAIYYKASTNSGTNWSSDLKLNSGNLFADRSSLCLSGNTIHVVWYDFRDSDFEIYYKRNPTGNPVSVTNINSEIPESFSLTQNYPNPFNPVTNIEFSIPNTGLTKLVIFDAAGREIETLVNSDLNPGTYKAEWDASKINSGVYFYRLTSGNFTETKKMILVK